jgi:kumamolisin
MFLARHAAAQFATSPTSVQNIAAQPAGVSTFSISRAGLTSAEQEAPLEIEVALKMRDYDELIQRVGRGDRISRAEMASRYAPQRTDYERVEAWLEAEGLRIVAPESSSFALFATGTVAQCARAFQVTFARVASDDGEYTSAISPPSIPTDLAGLILGVNGLQPHLHPRKHLRFSSAPTGSSTFPYLPAQIAGAYNASGLTQNGAGQKIGIVIDTFPLASDLSTFWSFCGIGQTLANIEEVQVVSGTLPAPSGEESLDVEWCSSIASGAKVRIYATTDLSFVHLDQAYAAILNDLPANPTLSQISLSYGAGESYVATAQLQTDAQYFASLAAAGVTVCAASGDGGSSPGTSGQNHNGPVQAETPASDASVTAVGGTSLTLDATTGAVVGETAWDDGGGGLSRVFAQPSWQQSAGAPFGSMRAVPDVAADADPNPGALIILKGSGFSVGGTSWSSPVWAGFCALINQSRAGVGLESVGRLGPEIYPMLGSSGFRDITTGSNGPNGVYDAGPGYDLCTGLGVPNTGVLLNSLSIIPPSDDTPALPPWGLVTLGAALTAIAIGALARKEPKAG